MIRSDLALAGLACAAVPGLRPVSVQERRRPPGAGEVSHQSALIEDATGRMWVLNCPLTAVAAVELERNDSLVRQLGRHVPFKVPAAAGYASLGSLGRAALFPYVEGSAIDLHRLPAGPGLASAVGRTLAAVHNIPAGLFEEHEVPVFDAAEHRTRRLADLDRAAETGHVPTGLLARWEQAFDSSLVWRFGSTPVHGSLDGWSFLVAFSDDDAATGRILALTGWGHAAVTDPAEDFATLVYEATPAAVDSLFESYALARSQRPDPHLLTRARLASEMQWIRGLASAVAAEDDEAVARRVDQLRKLDRLTSADDPLVPPRTEVGGAVVEVSHDELPDAEPARQDDPVAEGAAEQDDPVAEGPADDGAHPAPSVGVAGPWETDDDEQGEGIEAPETAGGRDPEAAAAVDGDDPDPTEILPAAQPDEGSDDGLDEQTRLHDLYGMPDDDATDQQAGHPGPGGGPGTEGPGTDGPSTDDDQQGATKQG